MKFSVALASSLAIPAMGEATGNSAIEKVIEMLTNMQTKGKEEMDKEKASFGAYNTWALGVQQEKSADIEDGETLSKKLEGLILAEQGTAAEAEEKIEEYADILAKEKENLEAIRKTREEEHSAFIKEEQDLTDSIYACDKAHEVLSSVPEKVDQAAFFTQMSALEKSASGNDKLRSLMEFLQSAQDPFRGARSRSKATDSIIEMIADLKQDFEGQIQALRSKETELKHEYDVAKQTSEQTIEDAEKQTEENKDILADAQEEEGKLTEEHNTASKNLASDKKYLAKVTAEHKSKSNDFKMRMKGRTDELTAIKKAIEIMKSPEVAAGGGQLEGNKKVGLLQKSSSFIQLGSNAKKGADLEDTPAEKAAQYLRARGEKIGSKILVQIAQLAQADPFAKIKKMIADMIARLEKESAEEKSKNQWCVENMKKNKEETEHYSSLCEKLAAQCEKLNTEIHDAMDLIAKLTKELEEIAKAVTEASTNRAEEKQENETTIKESDVAAQAISDAMEVLKKYYGGGSASAFVQQPDAEGSQPAYAGGEYKPMTESNGVVGLLEVLLEEMNGLVSATKASENDASEGHKEFLKLSKKSTQEKTTLKRTTEVQQTQLEEDLFDKKDDLVEAEKSLDATVKIKKESIDPQCIVQGVSFAEKQAKRQDEIDSLTEALNILNAM